MSLYYFGGLTILGLLELGALTAATQDVSYDTLITQQLHKSDACDTRVGMGLTKKGVKSGNHTY